MHSQPLVFDDAWKHGLSDRRFYVTGGTLPQDAPSYVFREADHLLHAALLRGENCCVLAARQMGKSSLLVRTAARLRANGVTAAILDPTRLGRRLAREQWYDGLLEQLGRKLGMEDGVERLVRANRELSAVERWGVVVTQLAATVPRGRLVVFIDEIDATRSLPFETDAFFLGMRNGFGDGSAAACRVNVTFCVAGAGTAGDAVRDPHVSPYGIGRHIELTDLNDISTLSDGLGRRRDVAERALERVHYWTGGQPYLTQRLCGRLAEAGGPLVRREVDGVCEELFLTPQAREIDDNLVCVRERLMRGEIEVGALLGLYRKIVEDADVPHDLNCPFATALRLAGVVRVEDDQLRVRNRIYRRVFGLDWIDEEMEGFGGGPVAAPVRAVARVASLPGSNDALRAGPR